MVLSLGVLLGWLSHLFFCYILQSSIENKRIRCLVTLLLCTVLTSISCYQLPPLSAGSMIVVAITWLLSIRLIHLTAFPGEKYPTFGSFLSQVLWPISPMDTERANSAEWPLTWLWLTVCVKLLLNHWVYRWFLQCQSAHPIHRICMFYLFLLTIPYTIDLTCILVRLLTGNRYKFESITNLPFLSCSLREFWGQRYNRIVNIILREFVFQPIYAYSSSSSLAAMSTFMISGLFHVHMVLIIFEDIFNALRTFLFFILHGLICFLEVHLKIQWPKPIGCLMTHLFLLITSPLILQPLLIDNSPFFLYNPPPLFQSSWIPTLPLLPCHWRIA